jgi:hypothetical protein
MRHLTRIVHVPIGVNILGLLELFALIETFFAANFVSGALSALPLCLGFAAIVGVDLWWRIRQPEQSRWTRLFSPFTGGCFIYIPIWLLLLVGLLVGIIFILIAIATHQ